MGAGCGQTSNTCASVIGFSARIHPQLQNVPLLFCWNFHKTRQRARNPFLPEPTVPGLFGTHRSVSKANISVIKVRRTWQLFCIILFSEYSYEISCIITIIIIYWCSYFMVANFPRVKIILRLYCTLKYRILSTKLIFQLKKSSWILQICCDFIKQKLFYGFKRFFW